MTHTFVIGLFRHSPYMPTSKDLMARYETLLDIVQRLGVQPSYFSAVEGMGRGGYKKFGSAFHKRVLASSTEGYQSVGLAATPAGSDAPGYDSFVTADFGYSPEGEQVYLVLSAQEPYLVCGSEACDSLIAELARQWRWDYGFGLEREASTHPTIFLTGGISDRQSPEDRRRVHLWYNAFRPEERRLKIRDVFPYNLIGPGHLARRLPNGRSVVEFIEADSDSALRHLVDDLWLWAIKPDRTDAVRDRLKGSGFVIAE